VTRQRFPRGDISAGDERHGLPRADGRPYADAEASNLAPIVGANLRRLRVHRGLSLERLAQASGVSRAMLSQVELGRSAPTINVLWRIARALGLPFSALMTAKQGRGARVTRRDAAKVLASHDGTFTSRALFPFDEPRRVEFYELRLAARGVEHADPHAAGTTENLVVSAGRVELEVGGDRTVLEPGDSIFFQADLPHTYSNPGPVPAVMFLVMSYADTIG